MTTTNPITTIRQEIIDYVNTYYIGIKLEEDEAIELADELIEIIEDKFISKEELVEKLHNKIKFCDQEMKKPENIAVNDCLGCIESKKKAFQEVIAMLQVKK